VNKAGNRFGASNPFTAFRACSTDDSRNGSGTTICELFCQLMSELPHASECFTCVSAPTYVSGPTQDSQISAVSSTYVSSSTTQFGPTTAFAPTCAAADPARSNQLRARFDSRSASDPNPRLNLLHADSKAGLNLF
jgi:hypothetical protein